MNIVEVFDPALCCSSGVCGPAPDEELTSFASALERLKTCGVAVQRHNLAQEPLAFAQNAEVKAVLEKDTDSALPLVFINGNLQFRGAYPSSEQLLKLLDVKPDCGSSDDDCCQSQSAEKQSSFVKVDAPKVTTSKESCCDPSSGCC